MEEAKAQLIQALNAVHDPASDAHVRRSASDWLQTWQLSVEAWTVSNQLLHDPSIPAHLQFYCSQTLRVKVQKDFDEVPSEAVNQLRASLIQLLLQFASGPTNVRVQLSLAISALAIHVPAQQWEGGSVIQWFVACIRSVPPENALPCLLELLKVLPQEAGTYQPSVRPERRRQIQAELAACAADAFQLLASCLQQAGGGTRLRVLDAFAAWLQQGVASHMDSSTLSQSPLVGAALQGLQEENTFDSAVDATVELIFCTSAGGVPHQHQLPLAQRLVQAVLQLRSRFQQAMAKCLKDPDGETDEVDTAKGIARLWVEIGEAYSSLIATGSHEYVQPVEALLEVAAFPDDGICAMTFNFWHRLSCDLTSSFSPASALHQANGSHQGGAALEMFQPAFARLVSLVQGRVRYPDAWRELDREERSDFKAARQAIGDTLVDAAAVLGGEATLKMLVEPLTQMGADSQPDWRPAEAALFCIRAVQRAAPPPSSQLLQSLFLGLPGLPDVPQLRYTACLLVGAYASWLGEAARAGGPPQLVAGSLRLLLAALGHPESAPGAASALRQVCEACSGMLGPVAEELLGTYARTQGMGPIEKGVVKNGDLQLQERLVLQVMEATAVMVSGMPAEQREAALAQMLSYLVPPLQQAVQSNQEGPAVLLIDRITIIFRYVDDPAAVTRALEALLPVLDAFIQCFGSSAQASEQLWRVPRYALKTAGAAAAPLLQPLGQALPHWFAASSHSAVLYMVAEMVKVFGRDPAHHPVIGQLAQQVLAQACTKLATLHDFDEEPDIADDVFLLASSLLHNCPALFVELPVLPALLDCATTGILVQHRYACGSVHSFLKHLFSALAPSSGLPSPPGSMGNQQRAALHRLLEPRAPGMLRSLAAGTVGALPSHALDQICGAVFAILQVAGKAGPDMLGQLLHMLPPETASERDRQHILAQATQPSLSASHLEEAMEELSELCRRNPRAQRAAEAAYAAG